MSRKPNHLAKPKKTATQPQQAQALQRKLVEAHREHQAGRLKEAQQLCLQILEVDTRQPDCLNLLGVLQNQARHFEDAVKIFRRAIALNDTIAHYHSNLGFALQAQGQLADAVAAYKRAVILKPDFVDGLSDLGHFLRLQGELEEARAHLEKAVALKPDHAPALNNLGAVERLQGKLDQAAAHLERALVLNPDYPEALTNLGAVLWELGELEQAKVRLQRALVLKPDYAGAHQNLGAVFEAEGQPQHALVQYERALASKPDFPQVQWNRSLIQLLLGDFAAGWHNYQWRYQIREIAPNIFPQPLWRGESLTGARILLHAEQGLGDTLQFLRYLPMVRAMTRAAGGTVLLDVPASMRRLAEQLDGIAAVTITGEPLQPFDWHCPLMGLPLAFRTTLDTIPAQVPYLSIPEAAQQTAAALSWPEQGLRVGLVWSGSPAHKNDRNRSLSLTLLAPLFAIERVHLFSLQLGPASAQLASFPTEITDLASAISDMADTAALMAHLDLVITVDTAVAHLAGALAKPVWMLLPFVPDWRWLLDREDSPWYPSMRLFRQSERNEWTPMIAQVRADLAALAGGDRGVLKPRVLPTPALSPEPAANSIAHLAPIDDPRPVESLQHKLAEATREHQAGRLEEAKQLCLQILQVDTRQDNCLNLLGVVQYQTGYFEGAVNMFRRAIAVHDTIAHYHANLGLALQAQGKLAEAVAECKQAVALKPDFVDGLSELGVLLRKQGELEEARLHLENALALKPDHAAVLNNLGGVLREQGKWEQAAAHLERALVLKPDYPEALTNLGAVLWELGELEQAKVRLQRALVLKPDYAEAYLNLGVVFEAQGQLNNALVQFERALALKPNFPQVHWNRSLVQLLLGDFGSGWHNYEWRYQVKDIAPRIFSQPVWRGESLTGARILLHAEQGLGDTLQFLRYLPMVCTTTRAAGGTVLLDVPSSMRRLAEQLPGIAELTVKGESLQPFDWHCPLMGLPLAFRTTLDTIPAEVPYLSIPEAAQQTAATLSWPEQGLRVGLVWSGSPTHRNDRRRSIPLPLLAPLLAIEGVHLFSLQLGPAAAQLASFPGAIIDLAPAIGDLADTAALMAHLDLVITVDTAVAHLAGALAKPVWVLLPFVPDWRWLLDREDSPWYPTMRLFRQPERNEWTPVIARVCADLAALAGGDRARSREVRDRPVSLETNHFAKQKKASTRPRQARSMHRKLVEADREHKAGRLDEAKQLCLQILSVDARQPDCLNLLGVLQNQTGQFEGAVEMFRRAIAVNDTIAHYHSNLGFALGAQGKLAEAVAEYRQSALLRPNFADGLSDLGELLRQQGELEEAKALLEKALALKPDHAEAYLNLGVVFEAQGQPKRALVQYERALALKPDLAKAHWNRSVIQLLLGDFAAGWHNYQWRYQVKEIAPSSFPQPIWRGESLMGARILLHAEQGLGDTLQFLRYLPLVSAAGGTVLLDVPASLRRLAEQLDGIATVTVAGEPLQPFDWHCPLMGLPLAFRTTFKTIPAQVPYLSIPEAAQQTATALPWPEQGLRVGLVWSGSPTHRNDRRRSIPLSSLAPLFAIEGVHLFSLQLGPGAAQLASFPTKITDLAPAIGDMADTAALMTHLDLVITVDTAVAHLAGALAKPVWVLLPFVPDWRWLLDREDSPWYPTMRLFRQPERNEWTPVVAEVRADLTALAGGDRGVLEPRVLPEPALAPEPAANSIAHLAPIDDPRPVECKICAGSSTLFGVVDFHKSCIEAQGKRLPLSGHPVYYRRCERCGFTFTTAFDAWDAQSFHDHIYNDDYLAVDPDFTDVRPSGNANLVASAFSASRNSIRILDYGGGAGRFAARLRDQGFSAVTYDPFSSFDEMPTERFDLVTSFEVLEHVPFPRNTVAIMVSLLKHGGAILFSTLVQPADFTTVGLNWWYAGPRNGHVSLYSAQSLALLFNPHGIKVHSFNANLHIAYREVPAFAAHLKLPG